MSRARDLADGTFSGDFSADSPTLVVDAASNTVGVGVASSYPLTVQSGTAGSSHAIALRNNSSTNISRLGFLQQDSATAAYTSIDGDGRSTGFLRFNTNDTERARIDSSGNVGINNSSPNTKIDVIGSTTSGSGIVDTIRLRNTGTTANDGAKIQFTAGTSTSGAGIGSGGQALDSADLRFYSGGNTERARIDSSGNLLVGTTTNYSGVVTAYANSDGANNPMVVVQAAAGSTSRTSIQFYRVSAGASVGSITTTNTATAYNTSSDYRLKENVTELTGAIDRVKQVPVHRFNFIADPDRTVDGFLAHEVADVVPEAVHGEKDAMTTQSYEITPAVYEDVIIPAVLDDDGNEVEAERTEQRLVTEAVMGTRDVPEYQGIDQAKLVPLLTAAIKEQQALIEDLQTRLAALEAV